jgi:uncharacterized protein (TIGR00369 family)
MEARTHLGADPAWCGRILRLSEGSAEVALETNDAMTVDRKGLVHGGFVFGLADYAAMLAVNDPNVVLGASESRFLKPVMGGAEVVARAESFEQEGRKHRVQVRASVGEEAVFEGTFTCFVLEHHVLDAMGSE